MDNSVYLAAIKYARETPNTIAQIEVGQKGSEDHNIWIFNCNHCQGKHIRCIGDIPTSGDEFKQMRKERLKKELKAL
jgi:hypothetical protein